MTFWCEVLALYWNLLCQHEFTSDSLWEYYLITWIAFRIKAHVNEKIIFPQIQHLLPRKEHHPLMPQRELRLPMLNIAVKTVPHSCSTLLPLWSTPASVVHSRHPSRSFMSWNERSKKMNVCRERVKRRWD